MELLDIDIIQMVAPLKQYAIITCAAHYHLSNNMIIMCTPQVRVLAKEIDKTLSPV